MNLKITFYSILISFTLIACQKKNLPVYNVYNGLKIGELISENKSTKIPDSLLAKSFISTTGKNSDIFYFNKNFNGKPYSAYVERRKKNEILSDIYIYFATFVDCDESELIKNYEHPFRNCLNYENPESNAISPLFENYLKQMLIDKYGKPLSINQFSPEQYKDEDYFRKDIKIKEQTWIKDYLQIKLISITDSWGYMRLSLYYSLTENYFIDFKSDLQELKKNNSNF